MSTQCFIQVVLDTPLTRCFDYRWVSDNEVPQVGQLALVPWGRRKVLGLIVAIHDDTDVPLEKIKEAFIVYTQIPPLSFEWIALCEFTSSYYQRSVGEVALAALPKNIRMGSERTVLRDWYRGGDSGHRGLSDGARTLDEFCSAIYRRID